MCGLRGSSRGVSPAGTEDVLGTLKPVTGSGSVLILLPWIVASTFSRLLGFHSNPHLAPEGSFYTEN